MKKLNIGIMAHVDAGKTTVTEGFLYHSGIIKSMGNVDDGTTTTDSMGLERERGMSIRAVTVSFMIGDTKINLIDTPGHMDFIAEVERVLNVLDGVILVISAREGVQPQTRVIFRKLRQMKIPVLFFINKVDRIGVDLPEVYEQIRIQLTDLILPMQKVVYNNLEWKMYFSIIERELSDSGFTEEIIEKSEDLLTKYLSDESISESDYEEAIQLGVNKGELFPIYHGAALQDKGITELMLAVCRWFRTLVAEEGSNLSAYVYKVVCDDYGHKQFYIRIYSGRITIRMRTTAGKKDQEMIIRNLFGLENGILLPKEMVEAGDVAVIMDVEELRCGDWIGERKEMHTFSQTEPLLQVSVKPHPPASRRDLLEALRLLAMEDPYLNVSVNSKTEEIELRLFGNLQKEILQFMLEDRYGLLTEFDRVSTVKKDKPLRSSTVIVPMGAPGNLLEAGIGLVLEPLKEGSGFKYETRVSYGELTKSFQNGVREGVEKGILNGLHGEVVDTKVIFIHSDFSSVTSTPADFRRLAEKVVYQALKEVGTMTMEPVMSYTLMVPRGYESKTMSELVRMNALMEETEYTQSELVIRGKVRLEACKDFAVKLLAMTEGKGIFETAFWQYRKME